MARLCAKLTQNLWLLGTHVQGSETASKSHPVSELIKCPNVSDIKTTHQYYIRHNNTNLYHSTGWISVTVGKHTKNMTALACPESVSCAANFHSGMLCIWFWYTESFVSQQGRYYTIVIEHTVTFLLNLMSTQSSRLLKEHSRTQNRI